MSVKRRKTDVDGIIVIDNPDKQWHESWADKTTGNGDTLKRHPLNIPHPFRAVLLGPPNSGKTNVVMNFVMYSYPQFEKIYLIHCDGKQTKEYKSLGDSVEILEEFPDPEWWEDDIKGLVIVDDKELKNLGVRQTINLDRLFGYVSTHKNKSVVCCSQDTFNIPAIIRRCSNLWVLWAIKDVDSIGTIARKAGLKTSQLRTIFKTFGTKDALWIDSTTDTPYPLRVNGVQPWDPDD